jgi:hypothetical protein
MRLRPCRSDLISTFMSTSAQPLKAKEKFMKRYANGKPLTIPLVLAAILFSAMAAPAFAAEGAWSSYTPGTYGDFSLNYAPPGVYVRENVFYFTGDIDDFPVAPGVEAQLDQSAWVNLLVVSYVSDWKLLGGNYVGVLNIPYGFSADLDVDVLGMHFEDRASGLGDIQVAPFGLMWQSGYFHFTLSENFVLNTGQYDAEELANIGRNYYSYETLFGVTWLHEKRGHEISFLAGYMTNQKNGDTEYRTGNEFHIDATVAQYFSESFSIGVVGYYYKQITADAAPGLTDEYKSESLGVGPAIMWSPIKDFQLIGKYITDVDAENHFQCDWGFVSACIKF